MNPKTRTGFSPRLDLQLGTSNTLTLRYQFTQIDEDNDGVGQLALASQAYNVRRQEQSLQVSDTQVLSYQVINETRLRIYAYPRYAIGAGRLPDHQRYGNLHRGRQRTRRFDHPH